MGGGGGGGGGGEGGILDQEVFVELHGVCVGYSCFKTSLVIPSLFATVPYNRHAQ